jgi:aminoglycoside phosphotransferase (APT) family kinase protein
MAVEAGWQRPHPPLELDRAAVERLIQRPVERAELLSGGLRNTNYRVYLADEGCSVVLRLYTSVGGRGLDTKEDLPCAREVALNELVRDRVPVPRVLQADPTADPAWVLVEFVDGERFDHALVRMSEAEVEQASHAAGSVLARIHAFSFDNPGFFGPRLEIVSPLRGGWLGMVVDGMSRGRVRERATPELADRLLRLVDEHGWRLEPFWNQAQLVHCDYKPWNMLVQKRAQGWAITAVLDWEFAAAGPPLCDIGIYLRYRDRVPQGYERGFFDGYRAAGGALSDDTGRLSRLIDLVSVCTFLERAHNDPAVERDMRGVIVATLEAFTQ